MRQRSLLSRLLRGVFYRILALLTLTAAGVAVVVQPIWMETPAGYPTGMADAERLRTHVTMLAENSAPRAASPLRLRASEGYIEQAFTHYGAEVTSQPFEVAGLTFHNIIAAYGPASASSGLLVVGAHYDAYEGLPGADDNASGVAGLLELARLFHDQPPSRRVELVAFALEEPPYFATEAMGSRHYVEALQQRGEAVSLMVCLEMIGYFDDGIGSQGFPLPLLGHLYSERGDFIALAGNLGQMMEIRRFKEAMRRATPLPVYSINAPAWMPGIDFSDHRNFWAAGFPALMVTDTAFYRNPYYHTRLDTPEKLDYRRMAQVVDGVWQAVNVRMAATVP